MEDDAAEQPFLPLDTLLEVSVVEDGNGNVPTFMGQAATKAPNKDAVSNSVEQETAWSAAQMAWGMDPEEDAFYNELFKDVSTVQYLRLHCTVCDGHLGCAPGTMLMRHVRLGTLICKECFQFYGTGEFNIAFDGSESFCCWCGQGGSVVCCSNCPAVFCKKCIKLNFTRTILKEIEGSTEWLCFVCNYRSLWEHRAVCRAAITFEASNYSSLQDGSKNENGCVSDSPDECCARDAERRRPRLKSSMPYDVTFGELVKSGLLKSTVTRMLKKNALMRKLNSAASTNSNVAGIQQETVVSVSEDVNVDSSVATERASQSSNSGTASYPGKTPHMPHKIAKSSNSATIDQPPPISLIQKPVIREQTVISSTTNVKAAASTSEPSHINTGSEAVNLGPRIVNSGKCVNIVYDNKLIKNGRVVIMPPLHLPAQSSLGIATAGSGTPQKTLVAMPITAQGNPMFQFLDQNLVVVSNSGRTKNFPIIVNSSSPSYLQTFVNTTGGLISAPSASGLINRAPVIHIPISSEKKKFAVNVPVCSVAANQEQQNTPNRNFMAVPSDVNSQKTNSNIALPNNPITHCPTNIQVPTTISNNTPVFIRSSTRENDNHSEPSVSSNGLIRVRSPSALQSVDVSDIQHTTPMQNISYPTAITGNSVGIKNSSETAASCIKLKKQPLMDSLLLDTLQLISKHPKNDSSNKLIVGPSSNSVHTHLNVSAGQQNIVSQKLVKPHSILRYKLSKKALSNKVMSSTSLIKGDKSQEQDTANSTNDSTSVSNVRSADIDIDAFRKNLLEGENLAKYMLTRITCLQEGLENKDNQNYTFDDMASHFSKLLEIASEKLNKVSKSFCENRQRWKKKSRKSSESGEETVSAISIGESDVETNVQSNIGSDYQTKSEKLSNEKTCQETPRMNLRTYRQPSQKKLSALEVSVDTVQGKLSRKSDQHTKKASSKNRNRTIAKRSTLSRRRSKTKNRLGQIFDHYKRNVDVEINREQLHQNADSCDTSEILSVNEGDFEIPEKRRKMKEVRIVLERIGSGQNAAIKKEPKESNNTIGNRNTNQNILVSQEIASNSVMKDTLLQNSIGELIKPCTVVVKRLNMRNLTYSMM